MYVRPLCIMAVGFLLGILVLLTKNNWILLPALGMGILLAGRIKREKRRLWAIGKLALYMLCFVSGAYRCWSEQVLLAEYMPLLHDGRSIILQGEVEEKEYKNDSYLYYLKHCYLKLREETVSDTSKITGNQIFSCNQMIVSMETDNVPIGKILVLEGDVAAFSEARNEGNFDEASFYRSQKIDFKLENGKILRQYGKANEFWEALYQLKQRLKSVYASCMTTDTGGVITMMALGDKSLMDSEIKALYQRVGISHVLAISGLHISVIGMTLYKLVRRVLGSFAVSGIFAGGFMLVYGCVTGFRPSSTRAIIMFLMMLLAQMIGRSYDSLSALSLSALCLLWENPFLVEYAGFLFSYVAVLGVTLVGKIVTKTFEEKQKIRDAIYTSFSIQLLTVPLTAYFYYEIPVYGMLVNFLVLPLMSALLFCGLLGGFVGLVWIEGAKWILVPCQCILLFYQWLSALIQKLPHATLITGQPEMWRMVVFYVILALVIYVIWRRKRARGFLVVGILLLGFVLYLPKNGVELDVLDVGQGDGIYLQTSSRHNIFFDGGSTSVSKVGTYRILPFLKCKGVRKMDYWFVSHADKDHISGLLEILKSGYKVEHLVFSENIIVDDNYLELVQLAEKSGTEVLSMGYLDCLRLGDMRLTCVFPYDEFVTDDKNAASLVLYYEDSDFDGLFTGDIGADEEKWIVEHRSEWQKLDDKEVFDDIEMEFYKVAHHGSRYSNGEQILLMLKPKIAVISCGENNWYGHPHEETLERLEAAGCEVWNTAEWGQISIRCGPEIEVITRLQSD